MENQVRPWKVLAQRDFGLFWLSLLISAVGNQISNVTIAWQVYEITNSPLQLGLIGLFRALPVIIFSLTGGVLADRMDRRRHTVIQLMTPDHLRGRVQSLVHVFVFGGPLIGQAQVGAAASLLGVPGAIVLGGVVRSAVVGLMAKRVSQLNQFAT